MKFSITLYLDPIFPAVLTFIGSKQTDRTDINLCILLISGDEGFKELSQFDPLGDELLIKAMDEDKSDEWFNKKGRTKLSE